MFWNIVLIGLGIFIIYKSIEVNNVCVQYEAKYEEYASNVNLTWNKYVEVQKKSIKMIRKIRGDEANEYERFKLEKVNGAYLNALAQQYPELKSKFEDAANKLESLYGEYIESQQSLNALIAEYNAYIASFPQFIFASIFGFKKQDVIGKNDLNQAMEYEKKDDIDDFDEL